ncbi:MAG TPA: hypothetical protein ENL20_03245 [Candidatus Cloacimonetes bacterium]|nr:hypothetical protein [Candidatus Cloacimonadota bacterium]
MIKYQKKKPDGEIIKHCFWEYKLRVLDVEKYINSDDKKLKKFVFEKIFCNSLNVLSDLMVFDKVDLIDLVGNYKVPQFNHDFLDLRHRIVRHLLLQENVKIPELEWRL